MNLPPPTPVCVLSNLNIMLYHAEEYGLQSKLQEINKDPYAGEGLHFIFLF